MKPTVSVLMPAYNAERFIAESVESVLKQTLIDFEFVVVDDASKDGTPAILQHYAARDSRLRYFRLPSNSGAVVARNTALEMSSAGLVAVLDADDVCAPERLERQVGFLRHHPEVSVVGSYVQLIDADSVKGGIKTYPSHPALMSWSMLFVNCFAHSAVMMRRSAVAAAGNYVPSDKIGAEDYDLFQRMNGSARFATLPEVLVLYRRWDGSVTQTAWRRQEGDADRIVRDGVARLCGLEITLETAAAMRGLATGNYPTSTAVMRELGDTIVTLAMRFCEQRWLDDDGREAIENDAAVKLWLLAALAATKDPLVSAGLASDACRLKPASVLDFATKSLAQVRLTRP